MDVDLFPVLVYEYDAKGRYGSPLRLKTWVNLEVWMRSNLRRILDERRELRITDTGDLLCFHCVGGKILYDGEKHYPEGK